MRPEVWLFCEDLMVMRPITEVGLRTEIEMNVPKRVLRKMGFMVRGKGEDTCCFHIVTPTRIVRQELKEKGAERLGYL